MIQLLLLFLLSHFIGDFVTQTSYMINRKREYWTVFSFKAFPPFKLSKGITEHVLHHFIITSILVTVFYGLDIFDLYLVTALMIISVVHYIIDLLKVEYSEGIIKRNKEKENIKKNISNYLLEKYSIHFTIDQLLHVITIYIVLFWSDMVYSPSYLFSITKSFIFNNTAISDNSKILLLFILLTLLTFGSGYLIASIFRDIKKDKLLNNEQASAIEQDDEDKLKFVRSNIDSIEKNLLVERAWETIKSENDTKESIKIQFQNFNETDDSAVGKYIGILERMLIAVFVVVQAYQGLILFGAIKTLTRFRQFEDKSFAEYYLIGTLMSMILGIVIGELIRKVFVI